MTSAEPLLTVRGLIKHFALKGSLSRAPGSAIRAVDDVSFSVMKGETLGVVGESGCGKSTLSRTIMALIQPTAGDIIFDGQPIGPGGLSLKDYRRQVQIIFQDSYSSLNPRLTVEESIAFAPRVHGMKRSHAIGAARDLLARVGLEPRQFARRYPHQLSGGQRQRVNIARALVMRPKLVILDEPVSALDKSVEAQVLNLLKDLKSEFGVTYLFISHDLNVVQYMADRILVMYLGRISEIGPADAIYKAPSHPYTTALFGSRPSLDPNARHLEPPLTGDPPNLLQPPVGCRFRSRCSSAESVCEHGDPELSAVDAHHFAACLMARPGSGHSKAPPVSATGSPPPRYEEIGR